jgi:ABC-type branched-subunit amino acid transport system substrate-binding protein
VKLRNSAKLVGVGLLTVAVIAAGCSSNSKSTSSAGTSAGSASNAGSSSSSSYKTSRGFDGHTIRVAGLEGPDFYGSYEVGAEARFAAFNQNNEIPGIKIDYVTTLNDNQDPAAALTDARQLVLQDNVFAIVPDLSDVNPGSYLASQQVPYVGWAFDNTYCSTSPSTSLWGFGFDGCLVPANPPVMPDSFAELYKYVSGKTGNAHPTFALFSSDTQSGENTVNYNTAAASGVGFDVVYNKGVLPVTVSDYTPYVQQWMTAAGGKQPDVITCYVAAQCIPAYEALKAAGFKGIFFETLGNVTVLEKPMAGAVTTTFYNTSPSAGLTTMTNEVSSFKAGTDISSVDQTYFAADMFIAALKKVGHNITPQAVQQALAHMTWSIPDLVGPVTYPQSTVVPTPACSELLLDSGSTYQTLEPYTCSSKTYPVQK